MREVDDIAPIARRPLSRREYDQLIARGVLGKDTRIELLYGRLVPMSPIGPRHTWSVGQLNELLVFALRRRARVQIQSPVAASDVSEPEPDVAVVPRADYLDDHARHALLVIEVADTSLRADRMKRRLYAAMGVAEYWIANLREAVVEAYHAPGATGYRKVTRYRRDQTIALRAFPDVELRVSDFIPPRPTRRSKPMRKKRK